MATQAGPKNSGQIPPAFPILIQRVITVGTPVLANILVSRQLGDRAFGQFALIIAIVTGFQIIAEFGLDKFLPREFVEKGENTAIFQTWTGFKITLSIIFYASAVLGSLLIQSGREITFGLLIYGISLFIWAFTSSFRSFFVARQRTIIIAGGAAVGSGLGLFFSYLILLTTWRSIEVVALILSGCSVLELIALARASRKKAYLIPKFPNMLTYTKKIWEFGVQTMLAAIYTRVGIFVLGVFGGALAVASYAKAGIFYSALSLAPAAAALAMYPGLVRLAQQGEKRRFMLVLWRNVLQVYGLIFPAIAILFFLGENIMQLVYRTEISSVSIKVLRVLLAAYSVNIINSFLALSLFALYAQNIVAKLSCLNLGVCIVANMLLVPYGLAIGTAWAVFVSEVGTTILFLPLLMKRARSVLPSLEQKAFTASLRR